MITQFNKAEINCSWPVARFFFPLQTGRNASLGCSQFMGDKGSIRVSYAL
jgi:hypothetical protein